MVGSLLWILQQEEFSLRLQHRRNEQSEACLISPPIIFLSLYSLGTTDFQVNKQAMTKAMVGPTRRPCPTCVRQPYILIHFL